MLEVRDRVFDREGMEVKDLLENLHFVGRRIFEIDPVQGRRRREVGRAEVGSPLDLSVDPAEVRQHLKILVTPLGAREGIA
jgi:hypothetical protein